MRLFLALLLNCSVFGNVALSQNPVSEDCTSKTCFPTKIRIGSSEVPLLGSKLFRYYLWTAYSIALYGPADARSIEKINSDVPKKLVLEYRLDFTAKEIIDAADQLLKKNPDVDMAKIQPQLDQINKLYQSIKEGERYSLEYEPGKGTTLIKNETVLGTISGADFGKHYLGIWLSTYPISDSMRDDLLGIK